MKKYDTFLNFDDVQAYQNSIASNSATSFVHHYVSVHKAQGISSGDDFYSLLLCYALNNGDEQLLDHIFTTPYSQNIFVAADDLGTIPLIELLKADITHTKQVKNYLKRNDIVIPKVQHADIKEEEYILEALQHHCTPDYTAQERFNDLVLPLYAENAFSKGFLTDLQELFNQPLYY